MGVMKVLSGRGKVKSDIIIKTLTWASVINSMTLLQMFMNAECTKQTTEKLPISPGMAHLDI